MRTVVQRVSRASVSVSDQIVGAIGPGLLLLVSAGADDGLADVDWMARKVLNLRIFPDDDGRMNRSVLDVGGALLSVSQFTLHGDARKGNRPSFVAAMEPVTAESMWESFNRKLKMGGAAKVETGRFGADMQVELLNDGPVTILLDSKKGF